jgi:hypothetical protein
LRGVRSCLLKYSDDVSRRRGVACLVRAIGRRSAAGGRTRKRGKDRHLEHIILVRKLYYNYAEKVEV